jgi:hypothetical protein
MGRGLKVESAPRLGSSIHVSLTGMPGVLVCVCQPEEELQELREKRAADRAAAEKRRAARKARQLQKQKVKIPFLRPRSSLFVVVPPEFVVGEPPARHGSCRSRR